MQYLFLITEIKQDNLLQLLSFNKTKSEYAIIVVKLRKRV